ncbi:MAG: hypothetical protein ACJAZW_002616 [Maritalea sp.]|jgi:hypothetical protein
MESIMDQVPTPIKPTKFIFGARKRSRHLMEGISDESLIYPYESKSQQRPKATQIGQGQPFTL